MTAGNKKWERWVASLALASSCVTGGLVLGGTSDSTASAPSEMVSRDQPAPPEAAEGGRVASPYTPGTYQEWRRKYGKAKSVHRPAPTAPTAQPAFETDPKVTEAMATLRGETLATRKKKWRWWTKNPESKLDQRLAELAGTPPADRRRGPEVSPGKAVAATIETPAPAETAVAGDTAPPPAPVAADVAPAVALAEPAPLAENTPAMKESDPPVPAPVEPEAEQRPAVVEATRMVEVKGPSRPVSTTPPSVEMRRRHGSKPDSNAGIQPARYHTTRPETDGAEAPNIPETIAAKYRSPYADWKQTGTAQGK